MPRISFVNTLSWILEGNKYISFNISLRLYLQQVKVLTLSLNLLSTNVREKTSGVKYFNSSRAVSSQYLPLLNFVCVNSLLLLKPNIFIKREEHKMPMAKWSN